MPSGFDLQVLLRRKVVCFCMKSGTSEWCRLSAAQAQSLVRLTNCNRLLQSGCCIRQNQTCREDEGSLSIYV